MGFLVRIGWAGILSLLIMSGPSPAEPRTPEERAAQCEQLEHNNPDAAIAEADALLADTVGANPVVRARALVCKAGSLAMAGRVQQATDLVSGQLAMELARISDPIARSRLMLRAASVHYRSGETATAIVVVDEALALAEREGLDELVPAVLGHLAIYQGDLGMLDRAIANHQRAIAMLGPDSDRRQLLPLHYNLGLNLRYQERFTEALDVLLPLVPQLETPGMEVRLASLLAVIGGIRHRLGDSDEAMLLFERSAALHREFDNPAEYSALLRDMAQLKLDQGEPEPALALAEEAMALAERAQDFRSISASMETRVDALAASGDTAAALNLLRALMDRQLGQLRDQQSQRLTELEAELGLQRQAVELEQLKSERELQALAMAQQDMVQRMTFAALLALALIAIAVLLWQRANNRRLAVISRTDSLTGLANRRHLSSQLNPEGNRPSGRYSALILVDLDHFKRINDSHGHDIGDRALLAVSRFLEDFAQRHGGQVGRWGGEEFCLLLPRLDRAGCVAVAETLLTGIASQPVSNHRGEAVPVSASLGLAPLEPGRPHSGQEVWEPAFMVADQLLYRAKHGGRNRGLGVWPMRGSKALDPNGLDDQLKAGDFELIELGRAGPRADDLDGRSADAPVQSSSSG